MSAEAIFQARTPLDMTDLFFLGGDIKASQHIVVADSDHIGFRHGDISMDFYGLFTYGRDGRVSGDLSRIIQYKTSLDGTKEVVFEWVGSADAAMIYKMFQGNAQYPYGAVSYLMTGNDIIKGSTGDDVLTGGAGNDYIIGGGGRDVFVYQLTGNGIDTIADPVAGDIIRVNKGQVARAKTAPGDGVTTLTLTTEDAPHTPITIQLKGAFSAEQFLIRGSDVVILGKARVAAAPPAPPRPRAAEKPRSEPPPPPPIATDRQGCPHGEIWHLMTLLIEARQGFLAPAGKVVPLKREQVEALWENLTNGWSIGMLVAVDTTGAETMPWPNHFGPWTVQPKSGKRIRLAAGADKIIALAWSLTEPGAGMRTRFSAEETEIWSGCTLVVDALHRRVGFVKGPVDTRRQLPVWLLPQTTPCLEAINRMEISPVDREWLNRTARRLLEARVGVHLFTAGEQTAAERMVANIRMLGTQP